MRISTGQFYETSAANYQRTYSNVNQAADQVSSGIKLNTASDDPVGASRVLQLQQSASLLTQYQSNVNTVNNNYAKGESAFSSIDTALQRVQELTVQAGNGGYSDKDRQAVAEELKQLQSQIFGLMNTQDADGGYLFSGSKTSTPAYAINSDGTYSYQGDQSKINVDIGDNITVATNSTGWDAFETSANTARTTTTLTSPNPDDGVLSLSGGVVKNGPAYNASFVSGQPYTVTFLSSTQFQIKDGTGKDVTSETGANGQFTPGTAKNQPATQIVSFRGLELNLNVNLTDAQRADPTLADAAVAGHTYTLNTSPSTISTARAPSNGSPAVITGTSITDQTKFNENFPTGGAVLRFTSATDFEVYAAPYAASSKSVAAGSLVTTTSTDTPPVTTTTATAAGVQFTLGPQPVTMTANDSFTAQSSAQQSQNILNTLSNLITALNTPADGNTAATQKLQSSLAAAVGNVASAKEHIASARSEAGARANSATSQQATNQNQLDNAKLESDKITAADPAAAATQLALQKTMLEASQLIFTKVASLNLFSKL